MVGTATPTTQTVDLVKPELVRPDQEFIQRVAAPPRARRSRAVIGLVVFGAASATLFGIFFAFVDPLSSLLTSGSVGGAAAVIGLALAFSVIHGSFANALLDVLGIRELKKG